MGFTMPLCLGSIVAESKCVESIKKLGVVLLYNSIQIDTMLAWWQFAVGIVLPYTALRETTM